MSNCHVTWVNFGSGSDGTPPGEVKDVISAENFAYTATAGVSGLAPANADGALIVTDAVGYVKPVTGSDVAVTVTGGQKVASAQVVKFGAQAGVTKISAVT